jgi:carboxymethylenebutenolidase
MWRVAARLGCILPALPCLIGQAAGAEAVCGGPVATFTSGGTLVRVETVRARGAAPAPAVLLAPGTAGLTLRERELCAYLPDLARQGFAPFLVHYLDRTGEAAVRRDSITRQRFALWQQALRDAVTHVAGRPEVDARRIGLVGFSLGAYLSLAVGWEDPRVGAVIDYYGGIPGDQRPGGHRPPVLILHGEADTTVPVREAHALRDLLSASSVLNEVKLYPGAGHVFDARGPTLREDALGRTVAFLRQHLSSSPPTR